MSGRGDARDMLCIAVALSRRVTERVRWTTPRKARLAVPVCLVRAEATMVMLVVIVVKLFHPVE